MITNDGKLIVLEEFAVDRGLPKYKKTEKEDEADGEHPGFTMRRSRSVTLISGESVAFGSGMNEYRVHGWPIFSAIVRWWRSSVMRREEERKMTVEEFFGSVKGSAQELGIIHARGVGYEAQIVRAQQTGQVAMLEQLQKGAVAVRAEAQLVALELPRYIEEDTLVAFVKQAKKGLRLDWVRNFTRHIPDDVLARKIKADDRGIFDNYVVLHYDPGKKSWAETEAEKTKRKDPILFGLIEGRRRLYFVGDWVDEFCDLTLDQIADQLGTNAVGTLQ